MKKWTFFVLLSAFLFFVSCDIFAAQAKPIGKNYLSLNNLAVHVDNNHYASMIEAIIVEDGTTYTLVLSYGFIGQLETDLEYHKLLVEDSTDYATRPYDFINDTINQRVYVEFITSSGELRLLNIPIDIQNNYEAILYQGNYASFEGFEPYLKQTETLSYEGVVLVNADELKSTEDIISFVTAKDPSGNIIPVEVLSDTYSSSDKAPGQYMISLKTSYNNISKIYELNVFIYDITAPILTLSEEVIIPLTAKVSLSEVISYIEISDNVDVLTHDEILIVEDTYSSANQVGHYHIKVSISDTSSNQTELMVPIQIIDLQAPTAEYPTDIFIYNTDTPLSNQEILNKFNVIDDVDGTNVTKVWTTNLYNQTIIPGVYHMQLTTKDLSNNTSRHSIYIHVIDNQAPQFEENDLIISRETHETMTNEEIIDWFRDLAANQGLDISHVRIIYNEYELADKKEGAYYVYLSYTSNDIEKTARILMQVSKNNVPSEMIYYGIGLTILVSGLGMYLIKRKKR